MAIASRLVEIITSPEPAVRDLPLEHYCSTATLDTLQAECQALDVFRRAASNLYERVRTCFFLYAIHRFHLPNTPGLPVVGKIPYRGYTYLLERRFEEAIDTFLGAQSRNGPSAELCSALSAAYHSLAFQTLADQVRRSVRSARGNQWMFRMGHPADHPLRVRVLNSDAATAARVRVVIESSDGKEFWRTMGVSSDVIEASLFALIDSIDHVLLK